jgi:hypothetical protein
MLKAHTPFDSWTVKQAGIMLEEPLLTLDALYTILPSMASI